MNWFSYALLIINFTIISAEWQKIIYRLTDKKKKKKKKENEKNCKRNLF